MDQIVAQQRKGDKVLASYMAALLWLERGDTAAVVDPPVAAPAPAAAPPPPAPRRTTQAPRPQQPAPVRQQ